MRYYENSFRELTKCRKKNLPRLAAPSNDAQGYLYGDMIHVSAARAVQGDCERVFISTWSNR